MQERSFSDNLRESGYVSIETGRGGTVEARVGSNFVTTVNDVAQKANYGKYFRVFLNGEEIKDPSEAPTNISSDMRIAITSYDKVG